ncbi:MAG: hypothetical protein IKN41_04915 [Candidatus Methanomethylophilaceae archaeon]|nr:hypothetical protein [Candidatus Methanomethylophilaceae archaeon]
MRAGCTHKSVKAVHEAILKLGNPNMVQIRRECPQYCTTVIGKSIGELKDRGLVTKDDQWPPRFTAHGRVEE